MSERESEVPEDKWLFEVAIIGMLEHAGVRQVVEMLTAGNKGGVFECEPMEKLQ